MATVTGSFAYENTKTEVTTTVTDPNGNTTASTADEWGRTTWVKPPAGAWIEYQYDTAHVHAATHLNGVQKYWYDANGNQTKRIIGSDTYDLAYDQENRLVEVQKNSVVIATFVYNGDGQRVKQTLNSVTTTFVGEHYEVTGAAVKKNYHAGAQLVAFRDSGTLRYVFGDHLGSSTVTADASGGNVTRQLFKAWGETRSSTSLGTRYQYTGQYSYTSDFGLQYFRARFYDPALGRFAQADTLIPNPGVPVDFDRYQYAHNNAVRNTDPSGHCNGDESDPQNPDYSCWTLLRNIEDSFGVDIQTEDKFDENELFEIYSVFNAISKDFGGNAAVRQIYQETKIYNSSGPWFWPRFWGAAPPKGGLFQGGEVWLTDGLLADPSTRFNIAHELGHILDFQGSNGTPQNYKSQTFVSQFAPGCKPTWLGCLGAKTSYGFLPGKRDYPNSSPSVYGGEASIEDFSDTFATIIASSNGYKIPSGRSVDSDLTRRQLVRDAINLAITPPLIP